MVSLLEAALKEQPPQMSQELPAVFRVLMPLLHSPLAAPRIQPVFLHAGHCLMPKHLQPLGRRLVLLQPGPPRHLPSYISSPFLPLSLPLSLN